MSKRSSILVYLLVGAALGGCSARDGGAPVNVQAGATAQRPPVSGCGTGTPTPVTISYVTELPQGQGNITISAEPVQIPAGLAEVVWSLDDPGYAFPPGGGIELKRTNPPQPPGPVSSAASGNARSWCLDAPGGGTWKYTIKFQSRATPTKYWECDPTIVNQARMESKFQTIHCTWTQ